MGTRPEATKGWLFARALTTCDGINLSFAFSGQQTQLLAEVMADLGPICPAGTATPLAAGLPSPQWGERFRDALRRHLGSGAADLVCVIGDTDTVRIAAEVAAESHVALAHLEAGIRHVGTYDRPEPEEVNRRLVSRLATYHFVPSATAAANLAAEGVPHERIYRSADLSYCAIASAFDGFVRHVAIGSDYAVDRTSGPYVLCTFHRSTSLWHQESLATQFVVCADAFRELTFLIATRPDTRWDEFYSRVGRCNNVELVPPLLPSDCLAHILQSEFVLTDSAGLQQEALILGKTVVGCRREIELYRDHPRLLLVAPPFVELSLVIGGLWPPTHFVYRGEREPEATLVRSEGLRIARELARHMEGLMLGRGVA